MVSGVEQVGKRLSVDDSYPFGSPGKGHVEGPHPLVLFANDPSRLDNHCGIHFQTLDQPDWDHRYLLVETSAGRAPEDDTSRPDHPLNINDMPTGDDHCQICHIYTSDAADEG